mgnify:CR=1 FL=1
MQSSPGASLSDASPRLGSATGQVRRIGVLAAVAAAIYVVDVVSKIVVVAALSDRAPIELLGGLGRHELHGRTLHRLGDSFRVTEVVLLSLGYGRTYLAGISRGS